MVDARQSISYVDNSEVTVGKRGWWCVVCVRVVCGCVCGWVVCVCGGGKLSATRSSQVRKRVEFFLIPSV
jgi:hypothetical protein